MGISNTGSDPVPERSFRGIADHIRLKVIHEGLELEELGIDLADIGDDVRLFEEDGLNLDSIDALEIVAGVQREFGLSLANVDQAFMQEHCATVGRLARMVEEMSPDSAPRGNASDTGTRERTPDDNVGTPSPNGASGERSAYPAAGSPTRPD